MRGQFGAPLTLEKYPLITISPQSIVSALDEIGDLDPRTRIRPDTQADMIFATATPRDHEKIRSLVDSLDGSGRQLKVVWLRRLPARQVAETLHKLMVGEKEEKSNSRRSYYDYYSYRSGGREEKKDKGEFRIDADLERNRLLLWCTEAEHAEVQRFLKELGEVPGESGNPHTTRFLTPADPEETAKLLEQLRRIWEGSNKKNKLNIQLPEPKEEESEDDAETGPKLIVPDTKTTSLPAQEAIVPASIDVTATFPVATQEAQDGKASEEDAVQEPDKAAAGPEKPATKANDEAEAAAAPAEAEAAPVPAAPDEPQVDPITITITHDGRIMLHSRDTAALDQLEDLLSSLTPPAPDYKVYYLKNAFASLVQLNLKEYFEEDEDFDSDENWMRAYYGMSFESGDNSTGLSSRKKLRFIYDIDTNSVLVANASPSQLATCDALIEIYDKAPSQDSYSARSFATFELTYSKADSVAKTIKEVFRDLLSSKDKDFEKQQQQGEKQGSRSAGSTYYRIYGSGLNDDKDKKPTTVKTSFEGALSVGVDAISNTIIVSAQEEWMPAISQMIEYLDEKAKPDTDVVVHRVQGPVNSAALQAALADILGEAWLGSQPPESKKQEKQKKAQPKQPMPPNQPRPDQIKQQAAATAQPFDQ